jgi:hypothetical protein
VNHACFSVLDSFNIPLFCKAAAVKMAGSSRLESPDQIVKKVATEFSAGGGSVSLRSRKK